MFAGKLVDLIQYPELQTDVFQHFKEFGNAIAFFHLYDKALVRTYFVAGLRNKAHKLC